MRTLLALYMLFVAVLVYQGDTQPAGVVMKLGGLFPYADKLGHMVIWGGLGAMANLATRFRQVSAFGLRFHIGSLLAFAIAFAEELSQGLFPHRQVDVADLLADALGIILIGRVGLLLIAQPRREQQPPAPQTESA